MTWTLCQVIAPATTCTGGTAIGSTIAPTTSGNDSTFTLPNPQTPERGGHLLLQRVPYTATAGGNYQSVPQQSDTECFSVTAATSSTTTAAAPGSVVIGPNGTVTDAATVTGNATGGSPDGKCPSACADQCRPRRCAHRAPRCRRRR